MPKRTDIKKIMVIGSGPIIIGQAAEFDYAGTQACLALKEEGYEVVLVNSNPATIMTDNEIADTVYIEPLTLEFVSKILREELPDAILPTLGGQTGLNMSLELSNSGILDELNIELIGTNLKAIDQAEDRELFRDLMISLGNPVIENDVIHTVEEALEFADRAGFPLIIRPAFTMGGSGGGICHNREELIEIVSNGLHLSPVNQCLIEVSIAGFKEIEYEVIRDSDDDTLVICSMENFDPVGIHTGDSIVFAPNQSLSGEEEDLLADISVKIIRALGIEGGCNVQLALNPISMEYYVIEVNPRVSRSSALASKATGFPIARVSAKIAVGLTLSEMYNPVTDTYFDQYDVNDIQYTAAKIPRFSFDKFPGSDRKLTTQMKATGEVMSLGSSIEESLLKAVRSLEIGTSHIWTEEAHEADEKEMKEQLTHADDTRLFYVAEALRRNYSVEELYELTKITPLFLEALKKMVDMETSLRQRGKDIQVLRDAKELGFSDQTIAQLWEVEESEVTTFRKGNKLVPSYLPVTIWDTSDEDNLPYYYSSYGEENSSERKNDKKSVLVLGSGPIRIGQGIEFDYATVHSIKSIKEAGYEAIIINSNPETVSTDFSISDKLYFDPLTLEDVLNIIDFEQPEGVVVQFGGQTSINLAADLEDHGISILGTTVDDLSRSEDRKQFEKMLGKLEIEQPQGSTALTVKEALEIPEQIGGYPVLVRPSYVLGGRGMDIVDNDRDLEKYMTSSIKENGANPTLIDKYVSGVEVEVDAISDGETVVLPGILEHLERAGIHSGDSTAVYPSKNLTAAVKEKIINYTIRLAKELNILGLMNIQFVIDQEDVYVIEVNPRASRTVPFLSKVTGIQMAQAATKVILGESLAEQGFETGLYPETETTHVKAPVFSFSKLAGADPVLSPEMKSTGEVMGSDLSYEKALYKAFAASGLEIEKEGRVLLAVTADDYAQTLKLVEELQATNYKVTTDKDFSDFLSSRDIHLDSISGDFDSRVDELLEENHFQVVVDTRGRLAKNRQDGAGVRDKAIAQGVALMTSLDTFGGFIKAIKA